MDQASKAVEVLEPVVAGSGVLVLAAVVGQAVVQEDSLEERNFPRSEDTRVAVLGGDPGHDFCLSSEDK